MRLVRRIWEAVEDAGLEAALELTDPDVQWVLHAAEGRVLTSRELLEFFGEFQGERHMVEARLYSIEAVDEDTVLASGSFRLKGGGGISDFQIHFVYDFDDGRLLRGSTYATRAEATDAIAGTAGG